MHFFNIAFIISLILYQKRYTFKIMQIHFVDMALNIFGFWTTDLIIGLLSHILWTKCFNLCLQDTICKSLIILIALIFSPTFHTALPLYKT